MSAQYDIDEYDIEECRVGLRLAAALMAEKAKRVNTQANTYPAGTTGRAVWDGVVIALKNASRMLADAAEVDVANVPDDDAIMAKEAKA